MVRIQAVLCGYYGMGNGGDEALLASLLQMLPEQVDPIVLSGNPQQTHDRYQVQAVNRKSLWEIYQAMRRSHLFIWGGGSLMQDVTSAVSPLYYAGLMHLAQRMGLTTIAWAQGIGPLDQGLSRWLAKQSFRQCDGVSVRDQGSAGWLAQWLVPFTLAPDPVWAMESSPVPGLWNLPAPRVAVSLRPHPQLTPQRLDHLTRALIDFQKATRTCVLLVPFQASQDLAIAAAIQPQLPGPSQIICLEDPQQLKGIFRGVEMAIAMRFHGLIMAAAEGCRCCAIGYDPKVSQLMQDLSLPGWELNQLPTNPNEISQTWIEQYANGEPLSADQILFLVDRALIHREVLHQLVASL